MRFGARAETPAEWLALKLNLGPKPLADTQLAFQYSQNHHRGVESKAFRGAPGWQPYSRRGCGVVRHRSPSHGQSSRCSARP